MEDEQSGSTDTFRADDVDIPAYEKYVFPCGESNPGHSSERAGS